MERILIIDDEETILLMIRQMLEEEGYEVVEALNGQDGLDIIRKTPIDLVVTDMVMPVKDGLKTIMELKKDFPDTPVIAISGGGAIAKERYLTVAGYLGDVCTIPKPFDREQLIDAVEMLLSKKNS